MSDRDRFDKFTERARRVLAQAQEEAQRFQHHYIGTEHLLLGLLHEEDGVAARVLHNLGIDLDQVRSGVEFIITRGDRIVLGEIGLTPRAKKVIELAIDEAHKLNHHYIGTEHLLLGTMREGEGLGAGVLKSLGATIDNVRTQTILVLQESTTQVLPSVPAAAAELVKEGEQAQTCSDCGARSPGYFRYCFHCGKWLGGNE
ncbi:MAG: hypothetical protein H0U76_12465 [Ktedonobacteraceae bacterium]|nr:hypothetical protein [Ktedonobacteraceae bacterium]